MPKAVGRDRRLKGSAAAFSDNSDGGNNAISMAESFEVLIERRNRESFTSKISRIRGPRERDRADASSVPHCGERIERSPPELNLEIQF